MQASDSSALSQDDHFLPNRPRLSFRVPEPVARPGQSADFAAIAIPSAGSVARPDVSVPAGETHALAHTLIRVLDEEGGAAGRSAERRVGKECGSTCRSRGSPYP